MKRARNIGVILETNFKYCVLQKLKVKSGKKK